MQNSANFAALIRSARKQRFTNMDCAARAVLVSPRKLQEYETGEDIPPEDIVYRMGIQFRDERIHRTYCNEICPIGQDCKRPTEVYELSRSVIRLQKEYQDVQIIVAETLRNLAYDDQVTPEEIGKFEDALDELRHLRTEIDRLELWAQLRIQEKEKLPFAEAV